MLKPDGERLKLEMARACLRARELAEKAGISVGVIYRMQKSYLIRPVYLGKVAKALGIDVGRPDNEINHREEIRVILDGVEERSQSDLCTYTKQKQYKSDDYEVLNSDYGDMIIEMVGKIEDERLLKYFYIFMSEKLKRVL